MALKIFWGIKDARGIRKRASRLKESLSAPSNRVSLSALILMGDWCGVVHYPHPAIEEIPGAKKILCVSIRKTKGKYSITFSVTDCLSLDKGPFNG
jgi:hypothetical protein